MSTSVRASASPGPAAARGRPRVLYLGGLGRSGTTVLERVVGQLPDACSVGELVHLWRRGVLDDERCGCGRPFSDCPFWRLVGDRAFGGWSRDLALRMEHLRERVDRTRFIPQLLAPWLLGRARRRELEEYGATFVRLHRAIAEAAEGAVVIDSSKHSSLAFVLRRQPEIDLHVLHVVRDSRGVAYSWTKEVRRPEASDESLMTRYSPTRSAALWVGHNLFFALLRLLGTPTLRLRYEDFVGRPEEVLRQVAAFAEATPPADLGFVDGATVTLACSHTVAGNPMRFRTGPLELRRDDAWRTQLPSRDRRLVSALTAPLLGWYGYLSRTGR